MCAAVMRNFNLEQHNVKKEWIFHGFVFLTNFAKAIFYEEFMTDCHNLCSRRIDTAWRGQKATTRGTNWHSGKHVQGCRGQVGDASRQRQSAALGQRWFIVGSAVGGSALVQSALGQRWMLSVSGQTMDVRITSPCVNWSVTSSSIGHCSLVAAEIMGR